MTASIVSPIAQSRAGSGPVTPLDIPRVFRRGFRLIRARPVTILSASLLLYGAPDATYAWLMAQPYSRGLARVGIILASSSVMSGLGSLLLAWLAVQLADEASLRPASVFRSAGRALAAAPALFALTVIYSLAVYGGMILLLVPGVMIGLAWSIGAPALAVERLSPLPALSRSADLTRGNRWRLFGLMAAVALPLSVPNLLARYLLADHNVVVLGSVLKFSAIAVAPLVSTLSQGVVDVLLASAYIELARLDRGAALAEVFA